MPTSSTLVFQLLLVPGQCVSDLIIDVDEPATGTMETGTRHSLLQGFGQE
jgi:hypothetical protein